MPTQEEWAARYRAKFAQFEVPREDREQLITEGEVGTYPGDDTLMPRIERSGRKEFDQLKSQRLDLTGQVKQARQREKELHPYPKLERFADRVLGYVPGILSPDVPPPQPSVHPPVSNSSNLPKSGISGINPNLTQPSRFTVEEGEIIDNQNRQIIAPHEFNRLSNPQEKDEVAKQLRDGGYLMDEPPVPKTPKQPATPTSLADAPVDLEIPEVHVVGERPSQAHGPRSLLNNLIDDASNFIEEQKKAPSASSPGEALRESVYNALQGLGNVPAGALKSIAIASKSLDEVMPDSLKDDRPVEERATYKLGRSIDELAKKLFPANPELQKNFFIGTVPRAMGNMAGFLGGAAVGALAKAPLTTGGMLGAQVGGTDQYEDAVKHGASDDVKQQSFWLGSAVGVSEIAPVGALFNRFNKATGGGFFRTLKEGGVTAAQEFIQEFFQNTANNITAQQLYDENRSWLSGSVESGSAGGVSGAVAGFISGLLQGRKARKQQQAKEGPASDTPFPGEPTPPPQPQPMPATPDMLSTIPNALNLRQQQAPFLLKKFPSPPRPAPEVVGMPQAPMEAPAPASAPLPQLPVPAMEQPPIVPAEQAVATPEPLPGAVLSAPSLTVETASEPMPEAFQPTPQAGIAPEIAPAIARDSAEPPPTPDNVIEAQAHEAATSPTNELPEPTEVQKEAGNYKKGHVRIAGLDISIENPQGSTRSGVDANGKPWSQEMQSHYGYIKGTVGKDKDHLDVFVKPGTPEGYSGTVYIVDQTKPGTKTFDEHKIILGASDMQEAKQLYRENYAKDWNGLGAISAEPMQDFKQWLKSGETTKPFHRPANMDNQTAAEVADPIPGILAPQPSNATVTNEQPIAPVPFAPVQDAQGNPELVYPDQLGKRPTVKQIVADWRKAGRPKDFTVRSGKYSARFLYEEAHGIPQWMDEGQGGNGIDRNKVLDALKAEPFHDEQPATPDTVKSTQDTEKPKDSPMIPKQDSGSSKPDPAHTPEQAAKPERELLIKSLQTGKEEILKVPAPPAPTTEAVAKPVEKEKPKEAPIAVPTPNFDDMRSSAVDAQKAFNQAKTVEEKQKQLDRVSRLHKEFKENPGRIDSDTYKARDRFFGNILSKMNGAIEDGLPIGVNVVPTAQEEKPAPPTPEAVAPAEKPTTIPPPTPEEATKPERVDPVRASQRIADRVQKWLSQKGLADGVLAFSHADLFKEADYHFGGTQAEGKYTPKDAFDALELGVNQYLHELGNVGVQPTGSVKDAQETIDWIRKNVLARIPTQQSRRTEEQDEFQQFSTPPDLAMAMTWVADVSKRDTVLEPSAGLGGLALFADNVGATVYVNEYNDRRASLLKGLGFDGVFTENAEQLNNILPDSIKPTVVIMNPPFSSTAGRMQGQRKTENVLPHLEQALKRLEPGGRLVALIGRAKLGPDPKVLEDWIAKTAKDNAYRARIGLSGKGYKKYGTNYDNQVLVFDKIAPDGQAPVIENVDDVLDAVPLLKEVRDARHASPRGIAPHELRPAQSTREEVPTPGEAGRGPERPVSPPVGTVGARPQADQVRQPTVASERPAVPGEPVDVGSGGRADVSPRQPRRPTKPPVVKPAAPQSDVGTASRESGAERAGSENERGRKPGLSTDEVSQPLTLESSTTETAEPSDELTDSVYESYTPRKVKIAGAKKHPGKLVESSALSAVDPPDASYRPHLPKAVIEKGLLSDAQLESVVYAGQAHSQLLPNGERRGFFLGDGPGVGKGRQIAAMILDNWEQGRKKTVWISETQNLVNSAVRDWQDIGGKPSDVFGLNKFTRDQPVDRQSGILYTTYTTMASGLDVLAGGKLKAKQAKGEEIGKTVKTRLDQVLNWLGPDFDGLIVFDEAHNMQNSLEQESERGDTKPAAKALASVTLQDKLPKARIVYASATAASRVDALGYVNRVGLWGEGTAFPGKTDFINAIESSGLGAMEIVAQNMKSMGSYISRSLDYRDVKYRKLEHKLTQSQREIYDEMANAWQLVLGNIEHALELTGVTKDGKSKNAMAKSAVYSKFWGANQRFWNQVLTSLQMPSVLDDMKRQLDNEKSLLVQLVNTNEAVLERQIQEAEQSGADLESLDMTPREGLMQYVRNAFPTAQLEEYTDAGGNKRTRIVKDADGNVVENKEAVAMREALLDRLGAVRVPEGVLEQLLNKFGPEVVAEVTGRSNRVYTKKNEDDGTETPVKEKRSPAAVRDDVTAFMAGKKRILVFSDKGGTGESYHADKTKKNQQQRIHYLVQPGWRADKAVQGLGRSHRTNQASAPEYALTMTDIKGHKRFISTIARRLDQLGALTKGQRQAGSSGLIDAKDNLENEYATGAINSLFRDMFRGQTPDFNFAEVTKKLGLNNLVDKDGALTEERIPTVPQFMNRLLSVDLAYQNKVFDEFIRRMDRAIEYAAASGTLDTGMETYRADGGIKVLDQDSIYEDPTTHAKVNLVHLDAKHKVLFVPAASIEKNKDFKRYLQSKKTGKVWAEMYEVNSTQESGDVVKMTLLQSPSESRSQYVPTADISRLYDSLDKVTGRGAWDKQIDTEPAHRSERFYMATGSILSIWDRLPKNMAKIRRLQTTDGQKYLGRMLPEVAVETLKAKLGKGEKKAPTLSPSQAYDAVLDDGDTLKLANDWKIKRVKVNNEPRIEIIGDDVYRSGDQLKQYGAFSERIQFSTRYFVPTDTESGPGVLEKILKFKPIVDVIKRGIDLLKEERGSFQPVPGGGATYAGEAAAYKQQRAKEDLIGFSSADADIEARVREAKKGLQPATIGQRIKDHVGEVWKLVSREFEHLPDTAQFSVLRNDLLKLQKYKGIAADKIQRDLADIIKPLSRKQYDQFEWKALLSDLSREAEQGHALPFGYTPEKVQDDLDRINEVVERDPKVKDAWAKRQQLWERIKSDYKGSMDAIGFDVSKKLTKQDYFRHQVLEHAKERAVSGTGSKIRTPTGRGFLKSRKGSSYDINANYVQAEFEVMAQMVYDTQLAKVIKNVDRHYNIRKELEAQAKAENKQRLADLIAENEEAGAMIELQLNDFKKRMGMHMAMLKKALELEPDDQVSLAQVAEIADDLESPGNPSARGFLKAVNERKAYVQDLLGPKYMTWDRLIPETHQLWQPREGNVFYMADSIPANLAKALQEGMLAEAGFPVEKLRKVLAQGGAREEYVIPNEAAETLDNLSKPKPNWFVEVNRQFLGHWKQLMLIAPRRVIRYNVRNLTGDADALFVGNPSAFKMVPRAAKELIPVIFKDEKLSGEAKQWAERGGYGTTLQFQELGDLNDLKAFQKTLDRSSKGGVLSIPAKVFNGYWKAARLATDHREAMFRYAAYLDYLKQMQENNGRPKNFGASKPETVMALPDIRDRAFKLSNELLGAYDRVSVAGHTIRNFWIPFYSWMEVNATRYLQLTKNAITAGNGGQLKRGAFLSTKQAAGFMIRLSMFWSMLQAWNYLMFGDDEDELRDANPTVANRPHILFGRDENGKIQYLSGIGALGDLLSWFGLDAFPGLVGDIMHDRLTIGEALQTAAKAPVNKIWQGITPTVKTPVELTLRESTYPDIFNPRPIQNRGDYLGNQTTFGPEIQKMEGKPGKPLYGGDDLTGLLIQRSDPKSAAYGTWNGIEKKYLERMGKDSSAIFWRSPRGEALSNWARALADKDTEAQATWKGEYEKMAREKYGSRFTTMKMYSDIEKSLRTKAPLAGVSKSERDAIVKELDAKETRTLKLAEQYYRDTIMQVLPPSRRHAFESKMEDRGWLTPDYGTPDSLPY